MAPAAKDVAPALDAAATPLPLLRAVHAALASRPDLAPIRPLGAARA